MDIKVPFAAIEKAVHSAGNHLSLASDAECERLDGVLEFLGNVVEHARERGQRVRVRREAQKIMRESVQAAQERAKSVASLAAAGGADPA